MKTNKQLHRLCVNHWRRMKKLTIEQIRDGEEAPTSNKCAFCEVYHSRYCRGCPIFKHTNWTGCRDTPYYHAAKLYDDIEDKAHSKIAKFREAVQVEIDFLESLVV